MLSRSFTRSFSHSLAHRASSLGLFLLMALLFIVPGSSFSSVDVEHLQTSNLVFSGESPGQEPSWTVTKYSTESLEVELLLPALQLNEVLADKQVWHILDIKGAATQGSTGEPGLPVLSRLVAVPRGMTLAVTLLSSQSIVVSDLHILPIQEPDAREFSFSRGIYEKHQPVSVTEPLVQVGRPAILAGRSVVPLSIESVAYDGATGEATVWTSVILQLDCVPDAEAASASKSSLRTLPGSFDRQLRNQVLGYGLPGSDHETKVDAMDVGFGTYVAVHSGESGVAIGIAPLLQWRREQGYYVVEMDISVGSGNASSIKTALQDIYDDQAIPPLEFITIFGDANGDYAVPAWIENLSGYGGGGDHYYTMLDGDDILSDAHVSRVSFQDSDEMDLIIAKILGYEKNPPMEDTGWFGRACLQGGPSSSGITTIYTNQWLKGQLQALGWATVDTTWSGSFITPMMDQVGAGVSVYGYRGYLGTSGISNGHVEALPNGGRLAVALLPTCASGSFVSDTTSRSEAWLRAPNGGAVAAVGTATTGTHTRYNNCYYLGTWDGLLNTDDHRVGVAHTHGKNELYKGYFLAEPHVAEIWAVWNNVMGDGATEMWTGVPQVLDVGYPTQVSLGAQAMTVTVAHSGQPVAGARVTLYSEAADFQLSGQTDSFGQIVVDLPSLPAGGVTVTVCGHNYLPHQSGFTVGQADVFCAVTNRVLDDGAEGLLNPGETVDLTPLITNHGTTDAFGVTAEIVVLSGPAALATSSFAFGTVTSGTEVSATAPVSLTVATDAEDGATIRLLLTVTDGTRIWTSLLTEVVSAPAFGISTLDLSDFGGSIDPGESGWFDVTLENFGSVDATAVSATLTMDNPWVVISDDSSNFGDIAVSGSGQDPASPFSLSVSSDCFGGFLTSFELVITYSGGLQSTIQGAVTIGTPATDQPSGPDAFGYYAYDNTDTDFDMAPTYDWVGIDPDHGGQGTDLGLTDFGWEQDDTKTVALPFTFGFYGVDYDEISICSNGWLAMGTTPVNFYRNFPMPSSHSAGAMIAPFWDNLNQVGDKKVYTWHDEIEHRFIIQWYEMPNQFSGAIQNFEVILLDPNFHPSGTANGIFIFQYAQVSNTDSRDGYATVGIQNMTRDTGLNYSYWNAYDPGAAPLAAGRAILFAPVLEVAIPLAVVSPGSFSHVLQSDEQVVNHLHIANNGEEGSFLNFNLTKMDPLVTAKALADPGSSGDHSKSLTGSLVSSDEGFYSAGESMVLPLRVLCSSPDDEWLSYVELDLPDGVSVTGATDFPAHQGSLVWHNETGDGVTTTWGDTGQGHPFLDNGETSDATVTLDFDPGLTGEVVIGWEVGGDNWGQPPHSASGEIVLVVAGPSVTVLQPANGDIAVLGSQVDVVFAMANGPTSVNIDLQREVDGSWQSLATDLAAEDSPWSWTVSGDAGPYGRFRVSDAGDAGVFGLSGVFGVSRNLDWLQLEANSGQVDAGLSMDLAFTLDASGLESGLYEANLIFNSNGGTTLTIPVNMTVSDVSPVFELPLHVALLGNHPNPFNPSTLIQFSLPKTQEVSLRVYSPRGRLVRSLLQGAQPAGVHSALWDGRDRRGQTVASGVYFYRLETEGGNFTGKMVLTK